MPDGIDADAVVSVHLDPAEWFSQLADETARGLRESPPRTPPVWFYDEVGSKLFDEITRLPEYYPTEAERSILAARASEIAALTGAETLVELGSGTSEKTMLLISALRSAGTLRRIAPLDVSEEVLRASARTIAAVAPDVKVHAVVGDFRRHLDRVDLQGVSLCAFLGSTIGNLDPAERRGFLSSVRGVLGADDWFLLGTDLVKDPARLISAYDDAAGVTAAFNRNAMVAMNRQLGADFDPDGYEHRAHWDPVKRRIEMHLVARRDQEVHIPSVGVVVTLRAGEHLLTEISSKFTREQVRDELAEAGLSVTEWWTDPAGDFLLTLARPALAER